MPVARGILRLIIAPQYLEILGEDSDQNSCEPDDKLERGYTPESIDLRGRCHEICDRVDNDGGQGSCGDPVKRRCETI